MQAAIRGMSPEDIAKQYVVTVEMARFRYNSTGVAKQVAGAAGERTTETSLGRSRLRII